MAVIESGEQSTSQTAGHSQPGSALSRPTMQSTLQPCVTFAASSKSDEHLVLRLRRDNVMHVTTPGAAAKMYATHCPWEDETQMDEITRHSQVAMRAESSPALFAADEDPEAACCRSVPQSPASVLQNVDAPARHVHFRSPRMCSTSPRMNRRRSSPCTSTPDELTLPAPIIPVELDLPAELAIAHLSALSRGPTTRFRDDEGRAPRLCTHMHALDNLGSPPPWRHEPSLDRMKRVARLLTRADTRNPPY